MMKYNLLSFVEVDFRQLFFMQHSLTQLLNTMKQNSEVKFKKILNDKSNQIKSNIVQVV